MAEEKQKHFDEFEPEPAAPAVTAESASSEDYVSLPPEEEILRLRKLQVGDLINELYFARQRLKNFMQERGIRVPEFSFGEDPNKGALDFASAKFIDNFSREAILGIKEDVDSVQSSVKSFVVLFDSLITTNAFEEVSVSVEGNDRIHMVKDLLEEYDNNRIDEDKRVVVAVKDLRDQLETLIDEDSSGVKNFEDVDDDDIAATRETGEAGGYQSKLGEGGFAFGKYSPFISQDVFDNLFSEHFAGSDDDEPAPEPEPAKAPEVDMKDIAPENVSLFDDNAEVPIEEEDIFDDFYDESEDVAGIAKSDKEREELSLDDIDKLIASSGGNGEGGGGKETLSLDDIDSLVSGKDKGGSGGKETLSLDDIDNLIAGKVSGEAGDAKVVDDTLDIDFDSMSGSSRAGERDKAISLDDLPIPEPPAPETVSNKKKKKSYSDGIIQVKELPGD